ncbi:hypothetical protein [Bacillus sp. MUM 13]|uniref:hypothetical protein n=1 Tax=Bacillus sp. MUM 13 TaxID=1678001 RepID=UPI0008F571E2|nr:hypothetical protein [Bacillus sp. MUM 13]OIK09312.1 hypothetical protein BIV59_17335 [Bacillus sp. MUM 13]
MNKELFTNLIGKVLRINRGGPESRTGILLDVSDDHLAILTDQEGVVYYKTSHIKSITENVKKGFEFKVEVPLDFSYKTASNFKSLLDELKNHWVNINRGGPEKLEGILCDINDEFVTVFFNEEVIRLALFHIRSISYGEKVEKAKEDEKAENNKDKNADKADKNADKKSNEKKK